MPACFQLYPIGSTEPAILQHVDNEMRKHFGCPPDEDKYLSWYGYIGFLLAMGKTFEWLVQDLDGQCMIEPYAKSKWARDMRDMLSYLMERYTTNAFYSPHH